MLGDLEMFLYPPIALHLCASVACCRGTWDWISDNCVACCRGTWEYISPEMLQGGHTCPYARGLLPFVEHNFVMACSTGQVLHVAVAPLAWQGLAVASVMHA